MVSDKQAGLIDEATALEEAGQLSAALSKWREMVKDQPTAVSLCRLGRLAALTKQWQEAEQALLASIGAAPEWALPLEVLALAYRDQGRLDRAATYLKRSLDLERKARTLTLLGDVYWRDDKVAEARAALEAATQLDNTYEEAYFLLAQITDDAEAASVWYRRAVALDPAYAAAHRELGWSLRRLNLLREAESEVRLAIDLDDCDPWSFICLGNIAVAAVARWRGESARTSHREDPVKVDDVLDVPSSTVIP